MAGFVRTQDEADLPPPVKTSGLIYWARTNLFATPVDTALTMFALALLAWFVPPLLSWLFVTAQWTGTDRTFCATAAQGGIQPDGWTGACWAFVGAKWKQFMVGRYPASEYWRLWVIGLGFLALFVPLLLPKAPKKETNAIVFFGIFPVFACLLLAGGAKIPFAAFGFVGFIIYAFNMCLALLVYAIAAIPLFLVTAFNWIGAFIGPEYSFGESTVERLDHIALLIGNPVAVLAQDVLALRTAAENWIGATRSFWIDYFASSLLALVGLRWFGRSSRSIFVAAVTMLSLAVMIYLLSFDVGLPPVETPLWGGLLVTLVISFVGIAVSLPLGIVLALGRRSNMPVIKVFSIGFIEMVRGVPLVTVLFMASVMLPLFLPPGVTFDKLLRVLIGVALFASAYMAEIVRGGLQAIPKGQYEGADSLGLGYWQKMGLIVLPQALKMVIPNIVSSFISLLKDTSLVGIIGMFDLLGVVRQNFSDAKWASAQTPMSGLVFAAFIFWIICFSMSRYSQFVERRLDTSHRK
jgi:general L-amino acid transport system permease protein